MAVKQIERNKEAQDTLQKLRLEGRGYKFISNRLNTEFDLDITHMDVKRYLEKHTVEVSMVVEQSKELRELAKEEILSTSDQMQAINKELWDLVTEAKLMLKEIKDDDEHDFLDKVPAIRTVGDILTKLLHQLDIHTKYIQSLGSTTTTTKKTASILQTTKVISQLKNLEDEGYIKILKKVPEGMT